MAKEIVITDVDLVSQGGTRNINIEQNDPDTPGSYKSQVVAYTDLSAAEKTQLDDCIAMLEGKLPA